MIVHAQDDVARGRVEVVHEVARHLAPETEGLHVFLEGGDFATYPNPTYRRDAFSMSITIGGIEECSPEHVLSAMREPDCQHVIWISRKVVRGSELQLLWVCTHELQHVRQHLTYPQHASAFRFLSEAIPRVLGPCNQLSHPAELDAEIAAWNAIVALRGEKTFDRHLQSEIRSQPKAQAYFAELAARRGSWSGDLLREIRLVLSRDRGGFRSDLLSCQARRRFRDVDLAGFLD